MDREDEAWAAVTASWSDESAHRAYLGAHASLEGLAEAGRRYRAALEQDPRDAVALRWRDEVVRRASAIALAQLPRTAPPRMHPRLRRFIVGAIVSILLSGLAWVMMRCSGAGPAGTP